MWVEVPSVLADDISRDTDHGSTSVRRDRFVGVRLNCLSHSLVSNSEAIKNVSEHFSIRVIGEPYCKIVL
jgi:hypothetical protein